MAFKHQFKIILLSVFCIFSIPSLQAQEDELPKGKLAEAAEAMKYRNFREAELLYRDLVKENPDDLTLQQLLCHALMNQKKFIECDSMLRRMVEKDTNNAGNYWYMGLSSERQRKDTLAAYWFKYYIRKTENFKGRNLKAWLHVGSAYRRLMHDSGINTAQCLDMIYHYGKYLKLNPGDPFAPEIQRFLDEVDQRKPLPGKVLIWNEGN